jgi:acyl transferase domain-containing protein
MEAAGGDATQHFTDIGHSEVALGLAEQFLIWQPMCCEDMSSSNRHRNTVHAASVDETSRDSDDDEQYMRVGGRRLHHRARPKRPLTQFTRHMQFEERCALGAAIEGNEIKSSSSKYGIFDFASLSLKLGSLTKVMKNVTVDASYQSILPMYMA